MKQPMKKSLLDNNVFDVYPLMNLDNHLLDFFFHKGKGKPNISFDGIKGYHIEKQIANINQIVFEVTDSCNLKCSYCGYGDIYGNHDQRSESDFPLESAKQFLDYIISHLKSKKNDSIFKDLFVSFYGGEPLLNFSFIKEIVDYTESLRISNITFIYSITTNALLLNRYMDFLVKKKFRILISLDGNKYNNSYRVNHAGENSFDRVILNIKLLQKTFPEFFDENVRFNAVLHNRNSVSEAYNFIKQEFGKVPKISELNNMGIREDKKEEFLELYQNKQESLSHSVDHEIISSDLFFDSPEIHFLSIFLHQYSGNVFKTYNNLLYSSDIIERTPTGTCFPFSKKVFVTVNGKILPCERIGHQFALGQLTRNSVELDFESIADRYNKWYKTIGKQCSKCYNIHSCMQCIFNIEDLDGNPVCKGFMGKEEFIQYVSSQITYLEKNPGLYKKIMEELIIE